MSIYAESTLGTSNNKIVFNDYTKLPIYRVVSRALRAPQIEEMDIPVPYEDGVSDFKTLAGSTPYVLEGIMYPGTEDDFDTGLAALRKVASLQIQQEDNDANDGYVPYVWSESQRNKQVFLKVLYPNIPESTKTGLVQPFQLLCKVADPTIVSAQVLTATTQGSDPTTAGGDAEYPFNYPVLYGASTYSTTATATNNGDLDGFPIWIKVYGPINAPTVSNTTTGEHITINQNVPSGSVLTIQYGKDFLTADINGISCLNNVSADTTFFKLQPGGNEVELKGSSFGSGAYVEVRYYEGYWPLL